MYMGAPLVLQPLERNWHLSACFWRKQRTPLLHMVSDQTTSFLIHLPEVTLGSFFGPSFQLAPTSMVLFLFSFTFVSFLVRKNKMIFMKIWSTWPSVPLSKADRLSRRRETIKPVCLGLGSLIHSPPFLIHLQRHSGSFYNYFCIVGHLIHLCSRSRPSSRHLCLRLWHRGIDV